MSAKPRDQRELQAEWAAANPRPYWTSDFWEHFLAELGDWTLGKEPRA